MAPIRFFLLGVPHIQIGDQEISIQRRKTMGLIAYLAVTGKSQSRDTLAAVFWPEQSQARARANLRHELFMVKEILGAEFLQIERDQVRLDPTLPAWVDVAEFQKSTATVKAHHQTSEESPAVQICSDCHLAIAKALALYAGDFMEGFNLPDCQEFNDWLFFESETLRRMVTEALTWQAEWHSSQNEFDQAILCARRWLAIDSLDESAHRMLMKLYEVSHQHTAALRQYQECARILVEELGIEPETETKDLYESIRSRHFSSLTNQNPDLDQKDENLPGHPTAFHPPFEEKRLHNLPVNPNTFIGRKEELDQIEQLLRHDPTCRCLTLTGPGGSGKTRLAVEAALRLASEPGPVFRDGIWFVSLAELTDPGQIIPSIAKCLNFSFLTAPPQERQQQLLDFLRARRMILILDNFEHLITGESVNLVNDMLGLATDMKILITSRERINIRVEQVFAVAGMNTPQNLEIGRSLLVEDVSGFSAIQLFRQCARRVMPGFELNPANLPVIIRICQVVEGMPLAIELAAAWLEAFSLAEILNEIIKNLDFLDGEWRDLPQRQRSIRAVFDSSWSQLNDLEKTALQSLTVFRGSFSLQAFQAVCACSSRILVMLIQKSWLYQNGDNRFAIHQLARQYASEKLAADANLFQQVMDRHSSFFTGYLDGLSELMKGPRQREAFQAADIEFDNIQVAWQWLVERNQVGIIVRRMLLGLFLYAESNSKEFEFIRLVSLVRNLPAGQHPDAEKQACILLTAQAAFFKNGIPVRNVTDELPMPFQTELLTQALSMLYGVEDLKQMNFWGILLAFFAGRFFLLQQGIDFLTQLTGHYRELKLEWEGALCLSLLSQLYLMNLNNPNLKVSPSEVRKLLVESMQMYQKLGNLREASIIRGLIGNTFNSEHNLSMAIDNWKAALTALVGIGDWATVSGLQLEIGRTFFMKGDFEQGLRFLSESCQDLLEGGHKRAAAKLLSMTSIFTVRYGDLETATQLRLQSLSLSIELGDLHGEAWSVWELGEIYRVAQDYPLALEWFGKAEALFTQEKGPFGAIFFQRGLGDLACLQGDFQHAELHFKESLKLANENKHPWAAAYALCGLGRSIMGSGQHQAAMRYFLDAASIVKDLYNQEMALVVIAGIANLLIDLGKIEAAIELAVFVEGQPFSWKETKAQVERVMEAGVSTTTLSPALLSAATQRGRKREIWQTIDQLLEGGFAEG